MQTRHPRRGREPGQPDASGDYGRAWRRRGFDTYSDAPDIHRPVSFANFGVDSNSDSNSDSDSNSNSNSDSNS